MATSLNRCLSVVKHIKTVSTRCNQPITKTFAFGNGCGYFQPCRCSSNILEQFKLASEKHSQPKLSLFRTAESDPTKHTKAHSGLYYTIDDVDYNRYIKKGQQESFHKRCVAFDEYCMMVRDPAVEIMDCLRASDLSLPIVRYILYGQKGVGKTVTMSHIMAYCGHQGWFVVHCPILDPFMRYPKDVQTSGYNPSRADTPIDCGNWLSYFQMMNAHLIPDVKLQNTYVWNKRESTEAGASMTELLEYGFSRTKYATDVMGAVLKELRIQSSLGIMKTLVAIDGVNALWLRTLINTVENRSLKYEPEDLNTVRQLRKMLQNNWSGGAAVTIVDSRISYPGQKASYTPRYLLNKEGQDLFEPHIPIRVHNYSSKEARSCMEYFIDRKWIQKPEGLTAEGQQEILFMTSQNPLEMYKYCSRW